ncbi:mitochondrial zinc maintenance protein 1, mitochondrial [Microdochium trichocladiopsis]|uniref:Mitochondrial zinc maintenance protein 1, mitochondrial n=1 Tax=Microdochium trichocladiopsis TaxID=1682393 RepID=A0A9P9BMC6_9PEZI|nr:mitochondrial zinc maintenance protein 1, mitochondrial [Microdochium trichocladiopsis]KAH7029468.1 mitochondrial zinc maintenance protein 1, mitochondrial [Microdochium trichocladiopsis]
MALSAYRNLWRSANVAFRGDQRMLTAARSSIRAGFLTNAHLEPSSPEYAPALQHANEVATILRQNVVQGKQIDSDGDRYKLNIHAETERGDNESIKFAGKKMARAGDPQPATQKCCSQ